MSRKDAPSYEELQQDHARHWKGVGAVRDARWQTMKDMVKRPWRCPVCGTAHPHGSVCEKCREARVIEVE